MILRTRAIAAVLDLESLAVEPITFVTVARRMRTFHHQEQVELRNALDEETFADDGALRWWDSGREANGPGFYTRGGKRDLLRGHPEVPVATWLPLAQTGSAAYAAALELGCSPVLHPTEPGDLRARWRDVVLRLMIGDTAWFDESALRQAVLAAIRERQAAIAAAGATP